MSLLAHILGLDNGSGPIYLAWSGAGADLGELAIVGSAIALYRRHTCHVDTPRFCWRPGVHSVGSTGFRTCRRHHPTVPDQITAEHIAQAHAEQTARSVGS